MEIVGTEDFLDTQRLDLFAKFISVDSISIPKQVFGCIVEWKGFDHLLCCPSGCRVSGNVVVKNSTAVMGKHDKDEQDFKPDRMHREEIDRNELRDVGMEKCLPRLRWRFPVVDYIFRDRGL